ncbi:hypothetical protein EZV62_012691 [Acer yangbiense]|uniref:Pentacotripeptide-repeat region of PRORP domain-containing protein n=1 Tax=Acer yangbiense TaxID=1000413 RepID=A0A5C7HWY3_9ROSI|nr:hypothetical protein EZV62_012691 [Acer yangbiense]
MSELKQIHAQLLRTCLFFDPYIASKPAFSALQDSGSLHYARLVFSQISNPTIYTCNSIIRGCTNKNFHHEALLFYSEMILQGLVPDRFTFPSLFKSCKGLNEGKQIHCHVTKLGFASDSYIQNTLLAMYSKCGCLVSAERLFDKMDDKIVVSWATMIGAYVQWNQTDEAIEVFERMESENMKPNEVTLVNVLTASLMDAYCKRGCVSLAKDLFEAMPVNNSLMDACTHLGCSSYIMKENIEMDAPLGTAIVDMYA